MQTHLSSTLLATRDGEIANSILRRCVHCGFCNATCPTYQLLGDELDGPRGRIYLVKQLLEGDLVAAEGDCTRQHLDRCLTCRNCETTCPSGVEYSRLLEIGRDEVERKLHRPWRERFTRWGLRWVIPYPARFTFVLRWAHRLRALLPAHLRAELAPLSPSVSVWPAAQHARRVILFEGCAQSVLGGEINLAAARVLDKLGISALRASGEGCCGALDQHLAARNTAADYMRANIDVWWPLIEQGVEAIVVTASACGFQVKDYGHLLQHDAVYAEKARRVSQLAKDIVEMIAPEPPPAVSSHKQRVAFHTPCTLQHGQRLGGQVEQVLRRWGFEMVAVDNGHLCCGAAGTYSVTQPQLSHQLRANKVKDLQVNSPAVIASANIGCLLHLRAGTKTPVIHWIELLAEQE
jgi:glycolate oxidase iron-sulfur subunit